MEAKHSIFLFLFCLFVTLLSAQRARDFGISFGVMETGDKNAITDVSGLSVGHQTIIKGEHIRTGATAIIPHSGNIFQSKVPAAIYIGNGFGKLAGYSQVEELGLLETPIILTNTLSVGTAITATIRHTISQDENNGVRSVNAVIGETNDGYLNDIRGLHVKESDILQAIANAHTDEVNEGNIGAGTGTICFGYKGGIGTSSRKLPSSLGGYTVGILVQTNFGGTLKISGVPIGQKLGKYSFSSALESADGSCIIVVATDAPLDARNLKRLAKRALLGLGRTGGIASNGSGDYVVAFSTAVKNRVSYKAEKVQAFEYLNNDQTSPLFLAAIEATEEAIINSLFAAESMTGHRGNIQALPKEKVLELLRTYQAID
ncbi:MAG: D-aminopeptidase [Cyclobacteriaceae bacterium]|jgi:D-aminopeptidase